MQYDREGSWFALLRENIRYYVKAIIDNAEFGIGDGRITAYPLLPLMSDVK